MGLLGGSLMLKAARGTSDVLPPETRKWAYLEELLRRVSSRYDYEEMRIPTFEHSELFSRTVGEATDIVEKEMYTFKDKTGRDLTLRPEATAGIARAFVEHGMDGGPLPRKFYCIGSMFRYEKPQAGRFREFRQYDVEVLGSASPFSDVEIILLGIDIARELGLTGTELLLNSIGCPDCRPKYKEDLVKYLSARQDRLCSDCRSRLNRNPLRVLDCREESCKVVVAGAPRMQGYLCSDCRAHWDELRDVLSSFGVSYRVDETLVRGLDYYTRTVFELKWPPLGAQNTLLGGGRYDGLVEEIGGQPTPGVGFAMGLERMLIAAEKGDKPIQMGSSVKVFVAGGKSGLADLGREVLSLVQELRARGVACDFDPLQRSLKAQMKQADRLGAGLVAILGEDEVAKGVVTVRSMKEGWQKTVARSEILGLCDEVKAEEVKAHGK